METWQTCLVALGVTALLFGILGCLYYYYYYYYKNPIKNDEEQYEDSGDADSHTCSMNVNEKKLESSSASLDLTIISPSPSPPTLYRGAGSPSSCLTELSAPPIHFFLRSNPSRQIPLPPPVVYATVLNDAKDIRRCLSLSPFLGQNPSSPDTSIVDSRSPSPALSKITTSLSSWKRKS